MPVVKGLCQRILCLGRQAVIETCAGRGKDRDRDKSIPSADEESIQCAEITARLGRPWDTGWDMPDKAYQEEAGITLQAEEEIQSDDEFEPPVTGS